MAESQDEKFAVNLLRMIAAAGYFQTSLIAAREMFGKSYFSLGVAEKVAVDQALLANIGANYQQITPDLLEAQQARQQMGFPIQAPWPTAGSSP
jgi:hypothetical protein